MKTLPVLPVIVAFIVNLLMFCYAQTTLKAKIVFFNKKSLEGIVNFSKEKVLLNSITNDIILSREYKFSEIEYIHPTTWNPEVGKFKKNRIEYFFYPVRYIVRLKNGEELVVIGRVKDFEIISFGTSQGNTKVYTYFVDYLLFSNGKGMWKNSNTENLGRNFLIPHPNVVFYIYLK